MIIDNIGIKIPVIDLPEYEPYLRMCARGTVQPEGGRNGAVRQVAGWIVHGIAIAVMATDIIGGNPVGGLIETEIISGIRTVFRRFRTVVVHFSPTIEDFTGVRLIGGNSTSLKGLYTKFSQ